MSGGENWLILGTMASAKQLLAAPSWSIEYIGDAVDDARRVDGLWYRRDIITRKYILIQDPRRVVPLFENPRPAF